VEKGKAAVKDETAAKKPGTSKEAGTTSEFTGDSVLVAGD
jgi:hypothetical protein